MSDLPNGFGRPDPGALKAQALDAAATAATTPPPKQPLTLDAAAMDAEIEAQQKAKTAAALHQPLTQKGLHRRLSDEEIIARGLDNESMPFEVPQEIIPDGMFYQWFRYEVFGQPDLNRRAMRAERTGWRAVPASRHDGMFMEPGHEGPIEVEGQRLYEIEENEAYNRHRGAYLASRMQRQNANDMLHTAPPGTGPRSHPLVRPNVRVTRESLPVE